MELILDCLAEIAGSIAGAGVAYLAKVATAYISEQRLERFIASMVKAAEQLYDKYDDEDGKKRLAYVETMLIDKGYEITAAIAAKIESSVYDLNREQKTTERMIHNGN